MWLPSLAGIDSSFQTSGTTITAHATIHTKGSWVELVASAPFDVTMLGVIGSVTGVNATDTSQLTDIGVGANPNEKVLIANIPSGNSGLAAALGGAMFPVEIPSGTRISARMQAVITVDVVDIRLLMVGGSSWSSTPMFQAVDTLGALTASSHGTAIGSGGTIYEIIASTAEDYKALGYGVDGAGDSSLGFTRLIEIFVGAGAAEKTLINNLEVTTNSNEHISGLLFTQGILPVEMNIPAGSRLSAQLDSAATNVGLVLYGFR